LVIKQRVLVTAGPTWVPVDGVRVIGNLATGETGILLAEKLAGLGATVTLLLGPAQACCSKNKKIRLIRFTFFDELEKIFTGELRSKKYDLVIHAAAVADYRLGKRFRHKLRSGAKKIVLTLVPTAKLVDSIKKIDASVFAVAFKFEPGAPYAKIIASAKTLLRRSGLDLVVGNTVTGGRYRAYIVGKKTVSSAIRSKGELAKMLVGKIREGA